MGIYANNSKLKNGEGSFSSNMLLVFSGKFPDKQGKCRENVNF